MRARVMLSGLLGIALMLCASPGAIAEDELTPNLLKYIESAETPEEHEELARIYRKQADRMRRKVESHELMIEAYTRNFGDRIDKWLPHCEALIEQYGGAAETYGALATDHEREALALKEQ